MTIKKGHNSTKGDNRDLKKNTCQLFLMRNPSMKFQNPILNLKRFFFIYMYQVFMTKFAKGDN